MNDLDLLSIDMSLNKSTGGKFYVYVGRIGQEIVYVGTTIQSPADRFRWHRNNGKNFSFQVVHEFDDEESMLDKEFELIKLHKPKFNKITKRKQNLNVKLTADIINNRIGDIQWCQSCLKRRVSAGYKKCYYC